MSLQYMLCLHMQWLRRHPILWYSEQSRKLQSKGRFGSKSHGQDSWCCTKSRYNICKKGCTICLHLRGWGWQERIHEKFLSKDMQRCVHFCYCLIPRKTMRLDVRWIQCRHMCRFGRTYCCKWRLDLYYCRQDAIQKRLNNMFQPKNFHKSIDQQLECIPLCCQLACLRLGRNCQVWCCRVWKLIRWLMRSKKCLKKTKM